MSDSATLQLPCLGRPFQLGMLYDCRRDELVPGITLWNEKQLNVASSEKPLPSSNFEIIAEDSIKEKMFSLGVEGSLLLSLVSGLISVSGSAKYVNDRKSSKNTARVTLKYSCTSKFQQLTMEQLATTNIQYPDVFDKGTATHVVTAVLYGAEAFFIFDREVSQEENYHDIHGCMEVLIKAMPTIVDIGGSADVGIKEAEKTETEKFQCKFYGDVILDTNPATFQQAVEVYRQLPKYFRSITIPKKVWLYPLNALNSKAARMVKEISTGLVTQTQQIIEGFHVVQMRSADLIKSRVCEYFTSFREQLSQFQEMVNEYKIDFMKKLCNILPNIRGGGAEERDLTDLIGSMQISPCEQRLLFAWLNHKEGEFKVLSQCLSMMEMTGATLAFVPGDVDSAITEYGYVLSFEFKVAKKMDPFLQHMSSFLRTKASVSGNFQNNFSNPWFKSGAIIRDLRIKAKQFTSFAEGNKNNKNIKFIITDTSDDDSSAIESAAAIVLYEYGVPTEFEPPSRPRDKPVAIDISHEKIHLTWKQPEFGTNSIKHYTVLYCTTSDKERKEEKTEKAVTSITIHQLAPETKYIFKVRAECDCGFSQESEDSDAIETKPPPHDEQEMAKMLQEAGSDPKYSIDELKGSLRRDINEQIKDLVSKMNIDKDKGLTEEELSKAERKFNQKWNTWMSDVGKKHSPLERKDLDTLILICIKSDCQLDKYDKLINSELTKLPLQDRGQIPLQLVIDGHRHLKFGFLNKWTLLSQESGFQKDMKEAHDMTSKLISEVKEYFSKKDVSYASFDVHIQYIVNYIRRQIDEFDEHGLTYYVTKDEHEHHYFTFTDQYRVDIILEAVGYALKVFTKQQNRATEDHPLTYLQSIKSSYMMSFKCSCTATAHEKASAMCLVELIARQLKKRAVHISSCGKSLAEIHFPRADKLTNEFTYAIISAADHAQTSSIDSIYASSTGVKQWLTLFQAHLKRILPLDEEELHDLVHLQEDGDLKFFTDEFKKEIQAQRREYLCCFEKFETSEITDMLDLIHENTLEKSLHFLQHGLSSRLYVSVKIIKSILIGPPGVGKTVFKSFLFNPMTPVEKKHHSTPISTVPVRAMLTSRMTELNDGQWLDIDSNPEKLFYMLADAIKYLVALPKEVQEGLAEETTPPLVTPPVFVNPMTPIEKSTPISTVPVRAMLTSRMTEPISTPTVATPLAAVVTDSTPPMVSQPVVQTKPATATRTLLDPSEVQDVLKLLREVKGSGELLDTKWMYLLDTGGQPQFADVSRPFIRANSVYFILIKLIEKLSDRPDFCYSENGIPLSTPCKIRMTNLQLIKHFVCSIISSKYEEGVADDVSSSVVQPLISIIGTYDDEYHKLKEKGEAPESIEEKDRMLLQEFEGFLDHFIFHSSASDELIHPVNNLCTGSERSQTSLDLRKKLLLHIQDQLKKVEKIPVHQYLFDILVKNQAKSSGKESHGVLTLDECNDIGKKLGIDVKYALKSFDYLNLYLYFADFQPLQHVVFTNPQYLLKLLSQLIQVSFVNQPSIATNAPRVLRDTGIFDVSLLDQLNLQFAPPHFTKEHFLQLLKFNQIIASVSSTQYFLPVALPPDELSLDEKLEFTDSCDPLFVKFNCNIVPQGVFLTIVVNLLNRQHPPTFSINNKRQSRTISKQLRYAIEFSSKELSGSLLLVEEFGWIEIYFNGMVCDCCIVRDAVKEAIEPCAKLLRYKSSALQYDLLPLCVLTQHRQDKLHPVSKPLLKVKKGFCKKLFDLYEKQLCWFTGIDHKCSAIIRPQLSDLCTLLAPIAPKYCAIGTALSVPMDTLGLVYSPETHQDNLRRTLQWWLNNGDKPTINSPVTWDNIISVVEGPVVQNYEVARRMRQSIAKETTNEETTK